MNSPATLLRNIAGIVVFVTNLILGIGLVVSAYAGCVSPVEHPVMGVAVLTFPGWLAAIVLMLVVDLIAWRRTALVAIIALVAAWPMVWRTCPLNIGCGIPHGTPPERVFTLLTYNVHYFRDGTGNYDGSVNPSLRYALETNADIVCLQEIGGLHRNDYLHITGELLDSIHSRYPYVLLNGHFLAVFSKFPLENLRVVPSGGFPGDGGCDIAAYAAEIDGRRVAIFNVHLQSYNLSADDKAAYQDLTQLNAGKEIEVLRSSVLEKLKDAARHRAVQAHMLKNMIEHYGGENVIVCGDFNDVPGCYTLRELGDIGMHEVWPAAGFGPTWTYNANRFYFRIDHVLWRGAMQPAGIERGNLRVSDHYPLLTTFVLDKPDYKTKYKNKSH